MTLSRLSRFKWILAAAGLLAFLALDTYATHQAYTTKFPGADDFLARWQPMHSWLLQGRDPYSDAATLDSQMLILGRPARPDEDQLKFAYPLYSVLFFGPLALISDYAWAVAIWLSILEVCLLVLAALSLVWSQWRPPPLVFGLTVLFSLFWYHAARTFLLGQFAGIEAVLLVGAVLAARSGHNAWAGVLLAIATAKPQMAVLLIPFLLLWSATLRRWSLIGWFVLGVAVLFGVSFLLLPNWLPEWLGQVFSYVGYTDTPGPVNILNGLLFPAGSHWFEYTMDAVLLAVLLWSWYDARHDLGRHLEWAVALTLVVTNLVAVRTATTNYVMMTPVLFGLLAFAHKAWGRFGLLLVALAEGALFVGLWALFLVSVRAGLEQPVMFLPLPFLLLAGLIAVRRASLHQPTPAARPAALETA